MGSSAPTHGKALLRLGPEAMLDAEAERCLERRFKEIDALAHRLLVRLFAGEPLVSQSASAVAFALDQGDEALARSRFALESQRSNGAWYVPDEVKVGTGVLNLGSNIRLYPRYAMTLAADQRMKVRSESSPHHVMAWSLVEPLVAGVLNPLFLRSYSTRTKIDEDLGDSFARVAPRLQALSTNAAYALQLIGSGWGGLDAAARADRRAAFLRRLGASIRADAAARLRLLAIRPLVESYYAKSKHGPPTQRQVVNAAVALPLSAYFGGSWLAFLDYIGESAHPDEQVITAIPRPAILLETGARAAQIAERLALPPEKVAEVVAKFWDASSPAAPVERRIPVMERFWAEFQAVHDRQAPGMVPLWGLVSDGDNDGALVNSGIPYTPGLYDRLLSAPLNASISSLWGRRVVAELPDVTTDCPVPNAAFGEAFGPALRFWQGCALTAWFLCEGPYSRTDMAGLQHHQRRELALLEERGCPIDPTLFTDLMKAEGKLGSPQQSGQTTLAESNNEGTFSVSISIGGLGGRRKGFEELRDVVARHRRRWTDRYLDAYLHDRASGEATAFAVAHARFLALKGKPPTLKALVKVSKPAADHWFGGDLRLLYAAVGERIPEEIHYVPNMPPNIDRYRFEVYSRLVGGGSAADRATIDLNKDENRPLKALSNKALNLIRLRGILGRNPTVEEFGSSEFDKAAHMLGDSPDAAWSRFLRAC